MRFGNATVAIEDWITPQQMDYVKVETPAEQLERIRQRAMELREAMGPRYLCHEKNRVRRLDGRSFSPLKAPARKLRALKQAA
ncbi:MAG: hypothetical protein H7X75_03820 [Burkholderiaceae bacterium]|nr:hypothetical protein [Burkholderiaceae bacterium]